MEGVVLTAGELKAYPRRKLVGEERGLLAELLMLGINGQGEPRIKEIRAKYTQYGNVVIGPVLNREGNLKKGRDDKVGVYTLS